MTRILLASPAGDERDQMRDLLDSCPYPVEAITSFSDFLSSAEDYAIVLLDVELISMRLEAFQALLDSIRQGVVLILISHVPVPHQTLKEYEEKQLWFFPEPLKQEYLFKKCISTLAELLSTQAMFRQLDQDVDPPGVHLEQRHQVDDLWFRILGGFRDRDD